MKRSALRIKTSGSVQSIQDEWEDGIRTWTHAGLKMQSVYRLIEDRIGSLELGLSGERKVIVHACRCICIRLLGTVGRRQIQCPISLKSSLPGILYHVRGGTQRAREGGPRGFYRLNHRSGEIVRLACCPLSLLHFDSTSLVPKHKVRNMNARFRFSDTTIVHISTSAQRQEKSDMQTSHCRELPVVDSDECDRCA